MTKLQKPYSLKYKKILFILLTSLVSPLFSSEGWIYEDDLFNFHYRDKLVYSSKISLKEQSGHLKKTRDSFVFFSLGDYFINNENEDDIRTLLFHLRTSRDSFALTDTILTAVWNIRHENIPKAVEKISEHLKTETDTANIDVLNYIKNDLTASAQKIPAVCPKSSPVYTLCRLARLEYHTEKLLQKNSPWRLRKLLNELSVFENEEELSALFLLNLLFSDLPAKLTRAGFPAEAGILLENSGAYLTSPGDEGAKLYTDLIYNYIISDRLNDAVRIIEEPGPFNDFLGKNELNYYLALLYYRLGDHDAAYQKAAFIDISQWKDTLNPFSGKMTGTEELKREIATIIWKAKGSRAAMEALEISLKNYSSPTPESQLLRLKQSQILTEKDAAAAEKISENIIYMSQKNGWKNAEYLATLLHGFQEIRLDRSFNAIIDFTKAASVIKDPDPASEWIRITGMLIAYSKTGGKSPVLELLKKQSAIMENTNTRPDNLVLTHYFPDHISKEDINNARFSHLHKTGLHYELLEELANKFQRSQIYNRHEEAMYIRNEVMDKWDTILNATPPQKHFLDTEINRGHKKTDSRWLYKIKAPVMAIFSNEDRSYIFMADPYKLYTYKRKGRRYRIKKLKVYSVKQEQLEEKVTRILSRSPGLSKTGRLQIYMNNEGVKVIDMVTSANPGAITSLFTDFDYKNPPRTAPKTSFVRHECTGGNFPEVTTITGNNFPDKKMLGNTVYILHKPDVDWENNLVECSGKIPLNTILGNNSRFPMAVMISKDVITSHPSAWIAVSMLLDGGVKYVFLYSGEDSSLLKEISDLLANPLYINKSDTKNRVIIMNKNIH